MISSRLSLKTAMQRGLGGFPHERLHQDRVKRFTVSQLRAVFEIFFEIFFINQNLPIAPVAPPNLVYF